MNREASADLIMKLYDLRREEKMRDARTWFVSFFPESAEDILNAMIDVETSAKYRMVSTYWDMAASFVNRGAIDEDMFFDSGGEIWVVFSKIQPYVGQMRETLGNPNYLKHLDDLVMRQPNALDTLAQRRETMKRWIAARSEMAKSA
ncbi:MAG: hypothetical protein KBD94_08770 [Pyrinomonadaceae bacterium]|nr:hypothetical protein [Pyrinomonadaceae bacterium]